MEFDLYIPGLKLAIEYQGEQHYRQLQLYTMSYVIQRRRDLEKKEVGDKQYLVEIVSSMIHCHFFKNCPSLMINANLILGMCC